MVFYTLSMAISHLGKTRTTFSRVQYIHGQLQNNCLPTAESLAAELGVTRKTIHRDILFMHTQLKLPVEWISAHKGYAYTQPVDSLPAASR